MDLKFGEPSPQFLAKHGAVNCALCRKHGHRIKATQIPQGWPKSITFKREFATCDEHLVESKAAAERRIREDRSDSTSEADYFLAQRYGI